MVMSMPANPTSQLQILDLGIIQAIKFIQKAVAMIYSGLFQDAFCMNLDILNALHCVTRAWKLITIKNYFSKCGFVVDNVYSNDDNEMKLTDDDKNDWHSL